MGKKNKFTLEEEEKVIEFVKCNDMLFDVRNKKIRDSEAKNRLWLELANEMNKDGKSIIFLNK